MQTGTGQLTPNNPNSVASIVQYGLLPEKLDLTVTGAAEVRLLLFLVHDFSPCLLSGGLQTCLDPAHHTALHSHCHLGLLYLLVAVHRFTARSTSTLTHSRLGSPTRPTPTTTPAPSCTTPSSLA